MKVILDNISFDRTHHEKLGSAISERDLICVEVDYIIQINNTNELKGTKIIEAFEFNNDWTIEDIKEKIKKEVVN